MPRDERLPDTYRTTLTLPREYGDYIRDVRQRCQKHGYTPDPSEVMEYLIGHARHCLESHHGLP